MANLVAIVGRPNVGKSTLFNRLTQSRRAIVSDTAGTTRDRQYGKCSWNGREFSVVDTGGWVVKSDDIFEDAIRKQVLVATEEADLVLFLVDVNTGLTDWDEDVALILRRAKLPVILVANKVDNSAEYYQAAEFYKLGLGDPQCISAATGGGTGDLLDIILDKLQDNPEEAIEEDIPRFAVVGRPNAGKSSIINAFIGEDRNIVTEIAGTTRDSIYTRYDKFGFDFYLVDTAGIRRKNKVSEDLEFYSVMRSIRAIENSDVCILMLDATRGIETQDMNIFQLIQKNNKSLVVVVNKWDLVEEKNQKVIDTFENAIRNRMADRILGMGDVVSLVERAQEQFDLEEAKKLEKKIRKNQFDFNDFYAQIQQIKKMGNIKDLASMIPGVGKAIRDVDIPEDAFKGVEAIIQSMTPKERSNPGILNTSRRQRIAKGSGTNIQDVNKLIKQFDQTRKMMQMMTGNKMAQMMSRMKGMPGMPKMPGM